MEITRESRLARWGIMTAVWAFVAALALWHTYAINDYVKVLDRVGTPAAANVTPLVRPLPGNYADAQAWVRYALASQETGQLRIRFTPFDNAPYGREVHWNSGFIQLISLAGRLQRTITGEPLPRATENALAWFNLPVLMACVIALSAWAAARAGAGAGALVAVGIIGLRSFYDGFAPNYVDHHGLLTAAVFGVTLGVLFMGFGWWQQTDSAGNLLPSSHRAARHGAIGSALCGAIGMWISAASIIPLIAIVGFAGLGVTLLCARQLRRDGAVFAADVWQLWGRVGGGASLLLYLIEYAPSHFSLRLEVNHPFYALAWWAAGELIPLAVTWYLEGAAGRPTPRRLALPLLAALVAPATIFMGGATVFAVRDPFLSELRHGVGEGMSLSAAIQAFGPRYTREYLINFIIPGLAIVLLFATRRGRMPLAFGAAVASANVLQACWAIRYWLVAAGPMLCLLLTMVAVAVFNRRRPWQWAIVGVTCLLIVPSGAIEGARTISANTRHKSVDAADLLQPIYRDIARQLRAGQPTGDIVLLANPDASHSVGYYGNFKAIGTLFWENLVGLKAAAAIYCAERDDQARALLQARGVTHVAVITRSDFVSEYYRLSAYTSRPDKIEKTFGYRLLKQDLPRWLRVIPYQLPRNIVMPDLRVLLLQVVPDQSDFDTLWNVAQAQAAFGNAAAAAQSFERAGALAPVPQRAGLLQSAGNVLYQQREHAAAIRLYRAGLALGPNPGLAGNLAWVLATSPEAALRNGPESLAIAQAALAAAPTEAALVNAYAGALAENGRFTEAAAAATQVLDAFRGKADPNVTALLQQRVDAYRARQPWRE